MIYYYQHLIKKLKNPVLAKKVFNILEDVNREELRIIIEILKELEKDFEGVVLPA